MPFAVLDPARKLTSGVIDLLFQSEPGWQIVDYKTDVDLDAGVYASSWKLPGGAQAGGMRRCQASVVSVRATE